MRPDICFVVNRVCQFMHAPIDFYWGVVKRILHYLQGTTTYGLHITRNSSFALHGFTNSDWACGTDDCKSTSGYLVFFGWLESTKGNTFFMKMNMARDIYMVSGGIETMITKV